MNDAMENKLKIIYGDKLRRIDITGNVGSQWVSNTYIAGNELLHVYGDSLETIDLNRYIGDWDSAPVKIVGHDLGIGDYVVEVRYLGIDLLNDEVAYIAVRDLDKACHVGDSRIKIIRPTMMYDIKEKKLRHALIAVRYEDSFESRVFIFDGSKLKKTACIASIDYFRFKNNRYRFDKLYSSDIEISTRNEAISYTYVIGDTTFILLKTEDKFREYGFNLCMIKGNEVRDIKCDAIKAAKRLWVYDAHNEIILRANGNVVVLRSRGFERINNDGYREGDREVIDCINIDLNLK